jgi:hypothetical protein
MKVLDCQPSIAERYDPKYGFQEGRGDAKSSAPMEGLREGNIHLLRNPPSLERPERIEELEEKLRLLKEEDKEKDDQH